MPERSRFPWHRRRELQEFARCGCMVSATMLEHDVEFTQALDILARRHGLPPYRRREPSTVIDLAEVRRRLAEAGVQTDDFPDNPNTDGGSHVA